MKIFRINKISYPQITISLLLIGIIFSGLLAIFLYHDMVTIRKTAQDLNQTVLALEEKNTDLRNSIYQLIDGEALVQAGARLGMVKDSSPQYLSLEGAQTDFVDIAELLKADAQQMNISVRLIAKNFPR